MFSLEYAYASAVNRHFYVFTPTNTYIQKRRMIWKREVFIFTSLRIHHSFCNGGGQCKKKIQFTDFFLHGQMGSINLIYKAKASVLAK